MTSCNPDRFGVGLVQFPSLRHFHHFISSIVGIDSVSFSSDREIFPLAVKPRDDDEVTVGACAPRALVLACARLCMQCVCVCLCGVCAQLSGPSRRSACERHGDEREQRPDHNCGCEKISVKLNRAKTHSLFKIHYIYEIS